MSAAYALGCAIGYFGRAAVAWLQKGRKDERNITELNPVSPPRSAGAEPAAVEPAPAAPGADLTERDIVPLVTPVVPAAVADMPRDAGDAIPAADDLTRLKGIGPKLAARLGAMGIVRFAQIGAWSADETDAISRTLGFPGRAARERWVEQAQDLCAERLLGPPGD